MAIGYKKYNFSQSNAINLGDVSKSEVFLSFHYKMQTYIVSYSFKINKTLLIDMWP